MPVHEEERRREREQRERRAQPDHKRAWSHAAPVARARDPPDRDQHRYERDHEVAGGDGQADGSTREREVARARVVERHETQPEGEQTEARARGVGPHDAAVAHRQGNQRPAERGRDRGEVVERAPRHQEQQRDRRDTQQDHPEAADLVEARGIVAEPLGE